MDQKLKAVISLTVGVMFFTACATVSAQNSSTAPSKPESSDSAPDTADLYVEFRKIAETSCERAYAEGVTERVVGSPDRLVLLPVSYLYNDFFAAVVNDDGGVEPIWSTESFAVCIDYINFMMTEESGSEYELLVSGDIASGSLKSEYFVEDYGTIVTNYEVKEGVFQEVRTKSPDSESVTLVEYGTPSEQDIERFREAIDLFLATN
jgi:hypothetical protein